jgi:hypothetical protein
MWKIMLPLWTFLMTLNECLIWGPHCLWPCVSNYSVCWMLMKFIIGILYEKSSSKCQYHANQHSDSCALLKGINEFLLYLFLEQFCEIWCTYHIMLCWTSASFTKIRAVNAVLDLRVQVRVFLHMHKGRTIWHCCCIGWIRKGIVTALGAAAMLTGAQETHLYRFF